MKEKAKSLLWLYQRFFFYVNIAYAEAKKPLVFSSVVIPLLTLLAVQGVNIGSWQSVLIYIGLTIASAGIGWVLVKMGVAAYNQKLANQQSPELIEILKMVKEIHDINVKWRALNQSMPQSLEAMSDPVTVPTQHGFHGLKIRLSCSKPSPDSFECCAVQTCIGPGHTQIDYLPENNPGNACRCDCSCHPYSSNYESKTA